MVADFDNHAIAEHDNLVCFADGAQEMGNDDGGAVGKGGIQGLYDFLLVDGIQRVGSFVKEKVVRAFVEGTGNEDALALPSAKSSSQFPDRGLVALWHLFDFTGDVGNLGSLLEGFVVHFFVMEDNVVEDGAVEQFAVLHDAAATFPPLAEGYGVDVHPAYQNFAESRFVEAEQQFEQGGFAAAAIADNGGNFSFRNDEVDVFQYEGGMRGVLEGKVVDD